MAQHVRMYRELHLGPSAQHVRMYLARVRSMCGCIGNCILARAPIRPNSAWKALGVIVRPAGHEDVRGQPLLNLSFRQGQGTNRSVGRLPLGRIPTRKISAPRNPRIAA
jgi:hypothetical protein